MKRGMIGCDFGIKMVPGIVTLKTGLHAAAPAFEIILQSLATLLKQTTQSTNYSLIILLDQLKIEGFTFQQAFHLLNQSEQTQLQTWVGGENNLHDLFNLSKSNLDAALLELAKNCLLSQKNDANKWGIALLHTLSNSLQNQIREQANNTLKNFQENSGIFAVHHFFHQATHPATILGMTMAGPMGIWAQGKIMKSLLNTDIKPFFANLAAKLSGFTMEVSSFAAVGLTEKTLEGTPFTKKLFFDELLFSGLSLLGLKIGKFFGNTTYNVINPWLMTEAQIAMQPVLQHTGGIFGLYLGHASLIQLDKIPVPASQTGSWLNAAANYLAMTLGGKIGTVTAGPKLNSWMLKEKWNWDILNGPFGKYWKALENYNLFSPNFAMAMTGDIKPPWEDFDCDDKVTPFVQKANSVEKREALLQVMRKAQAEGKEIIVFIGSGPHHREVIAAAEQNPQSLVIGIERFASIIPVAIPPNAYVVQSYVEYLLPLDTGSIDELYFVLPNGAEAYLPKLLPNLNETGQLRIAVESSRAQSILNKLRDFDHVQVKTHNADAIPAEVKSRFYLNHSSDYPFTIHHDSRKLTLIYVETDPEFSSWMKQASTLGEKPLAKDADIFTERRVQNTLKKLRSKFDEWLHFGYFMNAVNLGTSVFNFLKESERWDLLTMIAEKTQLAFDEFHHITMKEKDYQTAITLGSECLELWDFLIQFGPKNLQAGYLEKRSHAHKLILDAATAMANPGRKRTAFDWFFDPDVQIDWIIPPPDKPK